MSIKEYEPKLISTSQSIDAAVRYTFVYCYNAHFNKYYCHKSHIKSEIKRKKEKLENFKQRLKESKCT